ncbi:MAG: hypothetical protein GC185_02360 [Alphaproteobacteria bacterium]|nr:hypothetical protein [Alphaproteobacteria bacterium]
MKKPFFIAALIVAALAAMAVLPAPAQGYTPSAQMIFDCANGRPSATNEMKRNCRALIVGAFRSEAEGYAGGLCVPPVLTDESIYLSMRDFYNRQPRAAHDADYTRFVRDGLYATFACSANDRKNYINKTKQADEKTEFIRFAEHDFNNLAYHSQQSGINFCVPLSQEGTDFFNFLRRHPVSTPQQWRQLNLPALLRADYPCRRGIAGHRPE